MAPEQTLRERWNIWAKEKNLCTDCTAMSEEFFLSQFDAMLAQDIEKIGRMIDECEAEIPVLCEHAFRNAALKQALSILEARRLSLEK